MLCMYFVWNMHREPWHILSLSKFFSGTVWITEKQFSYKPCLQNLSTTKFLHFLQAKRVGKYLPPAHHKAYLCPHLKHWKRKDVCNKTHCWICSPTAVSKSNQSCANSAGVIPLFKISIGQSAELNTFYFKIISFLIYAFHIQNTLYIYWLPIE